MGRCLRCNHASRSLPWSFVKPAAKGGDMSKPGAVDSEFDATQTRELRAMDEEDDTALPLSTIGTLLSHLPGSILYVGGALS